MHTTTTSEQKEWSLQQK